MKLKKVISSLCVASLVFTMGSTSVFADVANETDGSDIRIENTVKETAATEEQTEEETVEEAEAVVDETTEEETTAAEEEVVEETITVKEEPEKETTAEAKSEEEEVDIDLEAVMDLLPADGSIWR